MAGKSESRKSDGVLRVRCPDPLHANSKVTSRGTRKGKSGTRRRYECQPRGYDRHFFSVVVSANEGLTTAVVASPPPACVEHPDGRVIRAGLYPSKARAEASRTKRRQRYRCYPKEGGKHDFTPPLPRLAVDFGHEHCPTCQELTGVHHGPQVSGRHHQSLLSVVVDTLEKVAQNTPYTRASAEARDRLGKYKPRAAATPRNPDQPKRAPKRQRIVDDQVVNRRPSVAAKKARAHWHIAADWVEIYSPTCWEHVLTQLREDERKQEREPDPERPTTLLIDAVPASGKKQRGAVRKRWWVLCAAQTEWSQGPGKPHTVGTRLRQLRAMPGEDRLAWQLFLDELDPYKPEFVVCDMGTAQVKAVREVLPDSVIVPSLYHLMANVDRDLLRQSSITQRTTDDAERVFVSEILDHKARLRGETLVTWNMKQWDAWWERLAQILIDLGGDPERILARQERLHDDIKAVLPHLRQHPNIPLSTGGLENKLRTRVKPILEGRAHGFANIERTNMLLDLVVCDDHKFFVDKHAVAELLRADNEKAAGWSLAPRQVADRMTVDPVLNQYHPTASLLDYQLLTTRAMKRAFL